MIKSVRNLLKEFKNKKHFVIPVDYTNLSMSERRQVREIYIEKQGYRCCECKELFINPPAKKINDSFINWNLFPPNFLEHPVHLHHSHVTNLTIGAVHAKCNAYLWQYKGE